jgi:hypothetical protein
MRVRLSASIAGSRLNLDGIATIAKFER